MGDRREQDQLGARPCRCTWSTVDVLMNFSRSLLNLLQPDWAGERLVEAEGGDQDVRLLVLERVAVVVEMRLARPESQLVGRVAEVVEDQLELGKPAVQQGLEMADSTASARPACCR